MDDDNSEVTRRKRIKQHFRENRKFYIVGASSAVVGAAVTGAIVVFKTDRLPLEISQTAKNQALVVWKPKITQVALVKRACPEPIPVLDKATGETYASLRRAAEATGRNVTEISKDAQGIQERFEALPDSVFA